jgi:hypothetical protein
MLPFCGIVVYNKNVNFAQFRFEGAICASQIEQEKEK